MGLLFDSVMAWDKLSNAVPAQPCVSPKKESAHRKDAVGGIISASHLRQQSGRDSDHGSKSSMNSRFVSSICSGIFSSRYFRYS